MPCHGMHRPTKRRQTKQDPGPDPTYHKVRGLRKGNYCGCLGQMSRVPETPPSNGVGRPMTRAPPVASPLSSQKDDYVRGWHQEPLTPITSSEKPRRSNSNRVPMRDPAKTPGSTLAKTSLTYVHVLHRMISATCPFTRARSREKPKHRPGLRQKLVPAEQFTTESNAQYDKRSATRQTARSIASDRKLICILTSVTTPTPTENEQMSRRDCDRNSNRQRLLFERIGAGNRHMAG